MKTEDKEIIKESILKSINELEDELKMMEESAKPISPDSAYGRLSRMDAINNKTITDAALRDSKTRMDRLRFALSKIEIDEYGKCAKCGNEIALKRLISIPYANLCITCAAKYR
jgi:DnaK suppressor protein